MKKLLEIREPKSEIRDPGLVPGQESAGISAEFLIAPIRNCFEVMLVVPLSIAHCLSVTIFFALSL